MTALFDFIRSLLCRHHWMPWANLYGDQIRDWGWKRSVWRCSKCGRIQARDALIEEKD